MKTVEMSLLKGFRYGDLLGYCQVTYTSRNDSGQKLVYCLQYQGERWTPVEFMKSADCKVITKEKCEHKAIRLTGKAETEVLECPCGFKIPF